MVILARSPNEEIKSESEIKLLLQSPPPDQSDQNDCVLDKEKEREKQISSKVAEKAR